ncbi:O-methyltransferase [Streptomyces cavernicola]|uniref:Class I SAM-dependent methyltransferase n=1 Tax=Streptomyces cavernicola TaxID=3043613 RepID=A0ABT6SAM1_9ACTN|nr:class I SAM-dependent methyltransferase [Streptomyces sp. B-S-A6]MDI3405245.1 class I SAM-dependent methyltransferase [Streptomyces sp. B-S-A6]
MDTHLDMDLVRALHRSGVEHDAAQSDRLRRRRNLEPESAALLAVLLRAMSARRMVEIGTSNGYSAIWFADALRATGGQPLLSVDLDGAAQREAAANLAAARLDGYVELREADGGTVLRELPDGGLDALFLDSERTEYAAWWPHPRRVLRPGGLLIVDNVLSHADEAAEFLGLVEADPEFTSTTAAVGKGLHLAVRATTR